MADSKFKLLTPEAVTLFANYPALARPFARPWASIPVLINIATQMENPDKTMTFDWNIMRGVNKEHRHLHNVFVYEVFDLQTLRWPPFLALTKHYQKTNAIPVIGVSYQHKAVELYEADPKLTLLELRTRTHQHGLAEVKACNQWDNRSHRKMVNWFIHEVKRMILVLENEEKAFKEQVAKAKAIRDAFDVELGKMHEKLMKAHAQLSNDIEALGIDKTLYNTNELLGLSPHSLGFTDWVLDDDDTRY